MRELFRPETNDADMWGTPRVLAEAIVDNVMEHFGVTPADQIFEPAYGAGAFLDALRSRGFTRIRGCEIEPELCRNGQHPSDALRAHWSTPATITNPPFSLMLEFAEHCKRMSPLVVFIAPLAMLEPCENRGTFRDGLHYVWPFRRMKFDPLIPREKVTTDPRPFGVFVWHRGHVGDPVVNYSLQDRLVAMGAYKRKRKQKQEIVKCP